jgi:hypothetical protein
MSDYRAIAAVSASIQQLLRDKMQAPVPVTLAPPDVAVSDVSGERVNLFLYKVEENASLKNMDLPGRGSPGAYGRPPLALDLHYLLTAYGPNEENQIAAHQILGDAMAVLHDHAVVLPPQLSARLAGEFENVKIYFEPMSLEELSKIWSSLLLAYRLSTAYRVTVVQIENRQPRTYPRPVGEPPAQGPRVHAITFRNAVLDEIAVIRASDASGLERTPYARIGDTLVLHGTNFLREGLVLKIGNADVTAHIVTFSANRITVRIPDDPLIQPGPNTVRLQNDLLLGEPPVPHRGVSSNVAVFVLVPSVTGFSADFDATPRTLTLHGSRLFAAGTESMVILGAATPIASSAYTTSTPASIAFPLPPLAAGSYPIRVRVNGAESFETHTLVVPA